MQGIERVSLTTACNAAFVFLMSVCGEYLCGQRTVTSQTVALAWWVKDAKPLPKPPPTAGNLCLCFLPAANHEMELMATLWALSLLTWLFPNQGRHPCLQGPPRPRHSLTIH